MKKLKFRFYIDHEHEEQWVNTMAETGWYLKKFWPFVYLFEEGKPGEYIYRNEMVVNRKKDYFEFLETINVERVHSFGVWTYFRKKRETGPFEIFSSPSDKIKYLNRINTLFIFVCLLNILVVVFNVLLPLLRNELQPSILWVSSLNILMGSILFLEIYRNSKRKKKLKMLTHIFEG